jgi:signal transduction histidine kinase
MQGFTCLLSARTIEIIYYTHVGPLCGAILLSVYLLIKTKKSIQSQAFFYFIISFCAWLVLDLVAWLPANYYIVSLVWSFFDYINVIFFLLGLYFFVVFVKKRDIHWGWKLFGFILTIPALQRMLTSNSIHEFDLTVCESINDTFLVTYKNWIEVIVILSILFITVYTRSKNKDKLFQNQITITAAGLLLFFITFAATDYVGANLSFYEIGLYGLFILPIFLGLIVYAIVKYNAFNVDILKAQVLIIALILLVCSQFFFMQSTISRIINLVTFLLVIIFGKYLIKEVKKDIENRRQLQFAYNHFKELEEIKSRFISFGNHQILNPLTIIKGYVSMLQEEHYGTLTNRLSEVFGNIKQTTDRLETNIRSYFDLPKFTYHKVKYDFSKIDVVEMIADIVDMYKRVLRNEVDVSFVNKLERDDLLIPADENSLREAFSNIIENCLKYTKASSISVDADSDESNIVIRVICVGDRRFPKVVPNIFKDMKHVKVVSYKQEIIGSDLGLYVAKEIIELHSGDMHVDYNEDNNVTTFKISLPLI